ncbi:MAG: AMP-binding protein [Rikenellaceae bacterium]|jgi:long-chain acyl-CoA synthetase|nr:AMP-binding protein [Rikenellaceae bacterium]
MATTLAEVYKNSVEQFADRVAFSMFERESVTYREFGERARQVQQMLLEAGVSAGDKVALLSSSMPNWPVCYFAVVSAGMIVVPILPGFSGEEFDKIIAHSESKALLVSDKLYTKLSKETLDAQNIVIRTKNLGIIHQKEGAQRGTPKEPTADDTATIIYTSGTTSSPKGVMLSHAALTKHIDISYDTFAVGVDDVFLSILPLSHTYECSIGMIYPFAYGSTVVYLDRPPTTSTLIPAMKAIRPTLMLSVPLIMDKLFKTQVLTKFTKTAVWRWFYGKTFFRKLLHRIAGKRLYKIFGGRMRFFGIGGAKLDWQTERFLLEGKFPYAIGYGLTETGPLLAGAAPDMVRLGSTGPAVMGVTLRLDDVNEAGEGEVVALSPCVMQGYFKNPEKTREAFTSDGWFRTFDLGTISEDGYLFIKGRVNSMLVSSTGENIYPEEIESILNSLVYVSDSLVTEQQGKLIALVQFNYDELERKYYDLKDNLVGKMEEIKKDVQNYVNSKVASFSKIAHVEEQKEEFQKTPSMKIKRFLYPLKKDEPST